jgi:hypothetical protein
MTQKDIRIQVMYEALQAAAYYISRLEAAQQRRKVRDMAEAMEHYHRVGPPLIAAYERSGTS